MSQHLTEQELIEFQFDLIDGEKASAAAEHLAACSRCAEALRQIRERFSALELLRDEMSAPQELISAAVGRVEDAHITQVNRIGWARWLTAAAAVVVIGALAWMIGGARLGDRPESPHYAKDMPAERAGERISEGRAEDFSETKTSQVADNRRAVELGEVDHSATSNHALSPMLPADDGSIGNTAITTIDGDSMVDAVAAADMELATESSALRQALTVKETAQVEDRDKTLSEELQQERQPSVVAVSEPTSKSSGATPGPGSVPAETEAPALETTWAFSDPERGRSYRELTDAGTLPLRMGGAFGGYGGAGGFDGFGAVLEDPLGRAPFAPASAIELVVLPRRDDVQLTIYNSADLTLVREKRNLTLKRGWNWLQFMWANTLIDPTSLSLEPLAHKQAVQIQQLVYPARLKDIGRWLIRSNVEGQVPFEITYLTSGLSWRAFYMGTLGSDEKTMSLSAYVRVANNSGEDYEKAHTRLVVGRVHLLDQIADLARRQHPYGSPVGPVSRGFGQDLSGAMVTGSGIHVVNGETLSYTSLYTVLDPKAAKPKEIRKEGLSEYFLYSIEGTETIENQWAKRLLSFEAADVNVTNLYKYDERRWARATMRFLSFTNEEDHNLGDTPIPNGNMKIYARADGGEAGLSYVGGSQIKYIPVGEQAELQLGAARLVKVEPKLMKLATENYTYDNSGDISGWDEIRTWRIDMANARDLPVDVEITRDFGSSYWDLNVLDPASHVGEAIEYSKHDATSARFERTLPAHSRRNFGYVVRTYSGDRSKVWTDAEAARKQE